MKTIKIWSKIGAFALIISACNHSPLDSYLQVLQETTPEDIPLLMHKNNIDSVLVYIVKGEMGLVKSGNKIESYSKQNHEIQHDHYGGWGSNTGPTHIFDTNHVHVGVKSSYFHISYNYQADDQNLYMISEDIKNKDGHADTNSYQFNSNQQITQSDIVNVGKEFYTYYPNGLIQTRVLNLNERYKKQFQSPTITNQYVWSENNQIQLVTKNQGNDFIQHILFKDGLPFTGVYLNGDGDTTSVLDYRVYKHGKVIDSIH